MPYIKKQPNPNFQEPVFIPKTKIVDSGEIAGFGKWTLDEDGLLTIEGTGKMPDWDNPFNVPWLREGEQIKSVQIIGTVISIGTCSFGWCSSLERIHLPNSVTRIGDKAFDGCSSLESIILPNGVTSIGWRAFWGCSSLKSIILPN